MSNDLKPLVDQHHGTDIGKDLEASLRQMFSSTYSCKYKWNKMENISPSDLDHRIDQITDLCWLQKSTQFNEHTSLFSCTIGGNVTQWIIPPLLSVYSPPTDASPSFSLSSTQPAITRGFQVDVKDFLPPPFNLHIELKGITVSSHYNPTYSSPLLATQSEQGFVFILSAQSGLVVKILSIHSTPTWSPFSAATLSPYPIQLSSQFTRLSFSPDGRRLLCVKGQTAQMSINVSHNGQVFSDPEPAPKLPLEILNDDDSTTPETEAAMILSPPAQSASHSQPFFPHSQSSIKPLSHPVTVLSQQPAEKVKKAHSTPKRPAAKKEQKTISAVFHTAPVFDLSSILQHTTPSADVLTYSDTPAQFGFGGHVLPITTVAFHSTALLSPTPHHLVALGGADSILSIWRTDHERPLAVIEQIVPQPLTDVVWMHCCRHKSAGAVCVCTSQDGCLVFVAVELDNFGVGLEKETVVGSGWMDCSSPSLFGFELDVYDILHTQRVVDDVLTFPGEHEDPDQTLIATAQAHGILSPPAPPSRIESPLPSATTNKQKKRIVPTPIVDDEVAPTQIVSTQPAVEPAHKLTVVRAASRRQEQTPFAFAAALLQLTRARHVLLSEAKAPLPTQHDTQRIKLEVDQRLDEAKRAWKVKEAEMKEEISRLRSKLKSKKHAPPSKSAKARQHDPSDEEDEAPAPLEDEDVFKTEKSLTITLPRTSMQYGVVQRALTWIDSTIHVSSSLIIHITLRTVLADEPSRRQMLLEAEVTTDTHGVVKLWTVLVPVSMFSIYGTVQWYGLDWSDTTILVSLTYQPIPTHHKTAKKDERARKDAKAMPDGDRTTVCCLYSLASGMLLSLPFSFSNLSFCSLVPKTRLRLAPPPPTDLPTPKPTIGVQSALQRLATRSGTLFAVCEGLQAVPPHLHSCCPVVCRVGNEAATNKVPNTKWVFDFNLHTWVFVPDEHQIESSLFLNDPKNADDAARPVNEWVLLHSNLEWRIASAKQRNKQISPTLLSAYAMCLRENPQLFGIQTEQFRKILDSSETIPAELKQSILTILNT
ncbi:hypothetical protein BLNAU_19432 [Blattamonas nauphoetae]|uniref:Protein HIRA n=1 Tax=Blattamonas nauphoetae TaxID=2049346 RepID=A0ABQ9X1I8_9EUKA|nr:hypothetical protein BLNAU_19432 [Blattamonas nauphoetae]